MEMKKLIIAVVLAVISMTGFAQEKNRPRELKWRNLP
jgi:hypothetical protein